MKHILKTNYWIVADLLLIVFLLSSCQATGKSQLAGTENTAERKLEFRTNDEFLDYIQRVHINYMWEGAEPTSGLACERLHVDGIYPEDDADVITTGGSGFGIAGLLVGIDRGFISRTEGVERFHKITDYLAQADRFHDMWPHWLHGPTGKVKPFSRKDNGGDLVESAFLMQGLLCVRQYFREGNQREKELAAKIDTLWRGMEWNWYQNGQDVIYWHWSPEYAWEMNFPLEGYNEYLIAYILAAASPTYPVPASAYHNGWARGEAITTDAVAYNLPLLLKHNLRNNLAVLSSGPITLISDSTRGDLPTGMPATGRRTVTMP